MGSAKAAKLKEERAAKMVAATAAKEVKAAEKAAVIAKAKAERLAKVAAKAKPLTDKQIKDKAEKEAKAVAMAESKARIKAEKAEASAKLKAERDAKAAEKKAAKEKKREQQKAERAVNAANKEKKKADKKGGAKVLDKKKLGGKTKSSTIAVKDDSKSATKAKAKKDDDKKPPSGGARPSSGKSIEEVKALSRKLLSNEGGDTEAASSNVSKATSVLSMSTPGASTSIDDVKGILPTLLQRREQNLTPELVTVASTTVSAALSSTTKKKQGMKNPLEEMKADEGLFAPAVLLTKDVFGTPKLNALRAKIIKEHTNVIGKLTETSDSVFGETVLKLLFELADKDGNGTIDEEELNRALNALGCGFIPEKQVNGMFKRADTDGNCGLDYEEWCKAAPKTLKSALVKLAKKNGHELGFLA